MTRRGMLEDAVGLYFQLGKEYPDVVVRDGKTGADFYGELLTDKRLLPYLEPGRAPRRPAVQGGAADRPGQPAGLPVVRRSNPRASCSRSSAGSSSPCSSAPTATGRGRCVVTDRATGEERCKFTGLSGVQNNMGFQQGAPTYRIAQANGHLLLVNAGQWAYCFDLAEKRELWRYNLLGDRRPADRTNPPRIEPDRRTATSCSTTRTGGRSGSAGRRSSSRPTSAWSPGTGWWRVDPSNGQKLWVRPNISPKVQVFGDARHIFLVDGGQLDQVLRAVDGTGRGRQGLRVRVHQPRTGWRSSAGTSS